MAASMAAAAATTAGALCAVFQAWLALSVTDTHSIVLMARGAVWPAEKPASASRRAQASVETACDAVIVKRLVSPASNLHARDCLIGVNK
jgi:hypothetical protein